MGLYFYNGTNKMVRFVYAEFDPNCRGDVKWKKRGWWSISPGETVKVSSVWAGGHKFLYYAEDGFGHIWAGNYFTQIPAYAFDWCWNMGSTDSRTLGLKMTNEISSTSQDYKITINV